MSIPLYLFTYNCNKRVLDPTTFISKVAASFPLEPALLYVFGLEEVCSIMDGSFEESSNRHLLSFNNLFLDALKDKYGTDSVVFHTLAMEHVGAIGIVLISPYPLKFCKIKSATASCGRFYSSAKGAAAVRVSYTPTGRGVDKVCDLTFANAHLGAFEGEVFLQQRNAQVLQLMRSLDFGDGSGYGLLKPNSHTFFMGDLNYRTIQNYSKSSPRLKELAELGLSATPDAKKLEKSVLQYDELTRARANGDVFTGFSEHCITFPPTYKFVVGTAGYDLKRSPAWCDRILYQSTYALEAASRLLVHAYNSIKNTLSDHQPVFLHITVPEEPPESIIALNGYLQVLPSSKPIQHLSHNANTDADANTDSLLREQELLTLTSEVISGPTQIYMQPTIVDRIIQLYVRGTVDSLIGYGLWYTTVPRGRVTTLIIVLALWGLYWLL